MPDTPEPTADDQAPAAPASEDEIFDGEGAQPAEAQNDLSSAFMPTDEDYAPFDPREASSNQPPATVDEVSDSPSASVPQFDPRYTEEFEGLLFLGALRKRFRWMGHEFVIRTLVTSEVLEVGLMQKPYVGSMGEIKAYQAAVVAAAVLSVDGKPPPIPITDEVSDLEARFHYVITHWQPIVIDMLYGQQLALEMTVNETLAAMGKAQG